MLNEASACEEVKDGQDLHRQIDDAICNMQEVTDQLARLADHIAGVTTEDSEPPVAVREAPSLSEVLNSSANRIDDHQNTMLDQISRIRELLF